MVGHGIAQFARIHPAHGKHERRGLGDAFFVSVGHGRTGAIGYVAVAGAVHDGLGQDGLPALLGLDDDALDGIPLLDDIGTENIHQHLDAGFFHDLPGEAFGTFGINHGQAHVQRAGAVMGGLAALAQAFHEAQGESLDNLVSLAAQET